MHKFLTTLSLFTSFSTLICCALPALLVTLGMGATMIGLVHNVPELIWFSAHKKYFFAFSGAMLLFTGIMQWKNRNAPCPIDAKKAEACSNLRKTSKWVYAVSLVIYSIGFFFAFIAQYLI